MDMLLYTLVLLLLLETFKIAVKVLADTLKARENGTSTQKNLGQITEGTFLFKRKSRE